MDWQAIRVMVYGRLEGELQKQMEANEENPDEFKDMTEAEVADHVLKQL